MKKILSLASLAAIFAFAVFPPLPLGATAVSSYIASGTMADSTNVASSIVIRDTTGAVAVTSVAVSTSASANFPATFRGAYTSTQLSTLSANPGDIAVNITTTQLVISSATTTALPGAWIALSTSPVYTKLAAY